MICGYCQDGPISEEERDFHAGLHVNCEKELNLESEYWRKYFGFPRHRQVVHKSPEMQDIDYLLNHMSDEEVRRLKN